MTEYRFRKEGVVADYVRSGVGLAFTAPALFTASLGPVGVTIMGSLVALFAVYGLRTWRRQNVTIYTDEYGILSTGLFGTRLPWHDLAVMKLSYYSTKRDRSDGWMQLKLKGRIRSLRLDSTLDGFEDVVAIAAREAQLRDVALSHPTLENLRSLGVAPEVVESRERENGR